MKPLALLVVLVVLIGSGCKKKPKTSTDDPNSSQSPGTPTGGGGGGAGGGGDGIVVSGVGGGVVTNPGGAVGGGGGGGAAMAVRKAVTRLKDGLVEMKTLGQLIQFMLTENGKMPTKEEIIAELKQYPKLLQAVNDGAFILTGTKEPGGLWAYEVDSETTGGIILVGGTATRASSDEVKQYIAQLPPDVRAKLPSAQAPPMPQPKSVAANVSKHDMEDIRTFIDNASLASGKMPSPQQVLAALSQAQSPAAKLVQQGTIVIHPASGREEIWAYEAKALQQGGWVVHSNGVEQLGAADLKRRLGR